MLILNTVFSIMILAYIQKTCHGNVLNSGFEATKKENKQEVLEKL